MKKTVFMLVAAFAMVALTVAAVYVTNHTNEASLVKVDSVATMTYGLEGGGVHMLNWHERHRAQSVRPIDKSAMKLRPIMKVMKVAK